MKLKSLILGSVAAAGLSTAGYAADLGVLTSLDVCDSLGISGLTISSSDNCLAITGGVEYEFSWGDYYDEAAVGLDETVDVGDDLNDWESYVEAWVKFVGTASSDFGRASVTIKLLAEEEVDVDGEADEIYAETPFQIDEAYVSVGDTTVLMAGRKDSIANRGDDEPFNYLGLFNSQRVDTGVWFADGDYLGGHVIQVVSEVADGVKVAVGLENLEGATGVDDEGTLVGVVEYAGEGLTAHLTGAAIGILDGEVDQWAMHAGVTGTFDMFKVRAAVGYNGFDVGSDIWNALASAEASFDMFKIAVSGEYYSDEDDYEGFGIGGSIGATVTEGISFNLGGRYFSGEDFVVDADFEQWQVAAQLVASVTETIKATGEIGVFGGDTVEASLGEDQVYYGAAELAWTPGGGFESSIRGEVNSADAYSVTFKAKKEFK